MKRILFENLLRDYKKHLSMLPTTNVTEALEYLMSGELHLGVCHASYVLYGEWVYRDEIVNKYKEGIAYWAPTPVSCNIISEIKDSLTKRIEILEEIILNYKE